MRKVLVINLGWEQEPLIRELYNRGYQLYGVHYNDQVDLKALFQKTIISDLRDLETILEFAATITPDAVISDQCDYSHFVQALIASKFNLPGPGIYEAQISANKFFQREKAKAAGVNIPAFKLIVDRNEISLFAKSCGYPIILKPVDNRGSFGVHKVNKADEIDLAYERALVNSHSRLVIAEKFITGTEITIDGYIFNGEAVSLALAKKKHVNSETQVSVDIKYPGEFSEDLYEKALKNNEFVIQSLGYTFGMTHAEYLISADGGIFLVEAANRGGGVFTSEIIVPYVSGVNILSFYINDCINGSNTPRPKAIKRNQAILKFFSFGPGKIKTINGLDKLKESDNVLKYRLAVKNGDTIKPIQNDANRHGFMIVTDENDVRKKVEEFINNVFITYELS